MQLRIANWTSSIVPVVVALALVAVFALLQPKFLFPGNLGSIASLLPFILIPGIGLTFMFMMGSFDMSIVNVLALSASVTGVTLPYLGISAIFAGIGVGILCGLLNGVVSVMGRIPSFVATLGTMIAYRGVATLVTGGRTYPTYLNPEFRSIAIFTVAEVPAVLVWAVFVTSIFTFIAFRTHFGRQVYAIGENEDAAFHSGINIRKTRMLVFVISGLLAGLTGVLSSAQTGAASALQMVSGGGPAGEGILLPIFAAVAVGGTAVTGGSGGPHRTIVGCLILAILANGLASLSIHPDLQLVIIGIVAVVAIAAFTDRGRLMFVR
jgi:ribose/xylose/arabinose/galactoside ABC-type transport system permease subunit